MKSPNKIDKYTIAIIAITAFGALLRFLFLHQMGSFWFDEITSIIITRIDFSKIWEYLVIENNPPLSFLYLHFWIKLFGESENAVRISSIIPGVAAIPLTYMIGKEMFSKKTGIIAALFMSGSLFQIYYSAEARMYSLYQLLAISSIYYFWKLLAENGRKNLILYFVSSLLLIYTHIFAWVIIAFQNIFLFICRKEFKNTLKNIIITDFLLAISFLFWLIPKLQNIELDKFNKGWYFRENISVLFKIKETITDIIYAETPNTAINIPFVHAIIGFIFLTGFTIFLMRAKKNGGNFFDKLPKPETYLLLWMIFPMAIFFSFLPSGNPKYIIFTAPAIYLFFSEAAIGLKTRNEIKILAALLIFLFIFSNAFTNIKDGSKIYVWDEAANYVSQKERPGDKILINGFVSILEFRQYYKGNSPHEGFTLPGNYEALEKQIIKYNWNTVMLEKDYPDIDKKLQSDTENQKRIFLIEIGQPLFDPGNLIYKWFLSHGWQLEEKKEFNSGKPIISMRPKIYIWKKQ